jgi:hypothetical protein
MALGIILGRGLALVRQAPQATSEVPFLRVAVRILIAALIAVLLTYIVIEQVGTWRRRRSGRD